MTSRRRAATAAVALSCGAALLAGATSTGAVAAADDPDGEGDLAGKSAQQIADTALHELLAAHSLRLRTRTTAEPTQLDLTLDQAGNCAGAISKGPLGRVEIIKRGTQVWLKPDATFWKSQLPGSEGTTAADKYKDTYLHGTTKNDAVLQSLADACDLKAFQKSATGHDESPSGTPSPSATVTLTKGRPTTFEGTPVLPVVKKANGAVQTVYVAINGKHYPLKLTAEIDHETGTILLSNYDTPVSAKTPAPGDTVDISSVKELLEGQGEPNA
ncbi:hypothetical protein [Streptomyces inhibens]|uniref:hypothetical protein n=1 Tax=Streptomyces inhibens TaxID=2293571 RepID=UPI001EE71017|nr:hypothetical protein [Streptomyces inhibens]UKY52264.1 hypothetical protein KI385_27965 [Streptomyces inhibens]